MAEDNTQRAPVNVGTSSAHPTTPPNSPNPLSSPSDSDTFGTPRPTRVHVADIEVLDPDHDYRRAGRFPALESRTREELAGALSRCNEASDRLIKVAKQKAELMEQWAAQAEESFDDLEMFRRKQGN